MSLSIFITVKVLCAWHSFTFGWKNGKGGEMGILSAASPRLAVRSGQQRVC